jgi:hypothetical protein
MIDAVKLVTHDGRMLRPGAAPLSPGARPALLEITRSASRQDFHDREDFYIEKRSKSFAIMKGRRGCGASGTPGAGVTICAAPRKYRTAGRQQIP